MNEREQAARLAEKACPMDLGWGPCGHRDCGACEAARRIREAPMQEDLDRENERHRREVERIRGRR